MPRLSIIACCAAVLLVAAPLQANAIPDRSADRAELMDRWRMKLSLAQAAAVEGRHDDAATHYLAVIGDAETAGTDNLLLARAVDGLADLYRGQQRWSDAARLYQRSAALWDRLLGPDQPRLATTLQNLAVVYFSQQRYDDAEPLLVRATAIFERSFGDGSVQAGAAREVLRIVRKKKNGS